jgi:hypothetical protein
VVEPGQEPVEVQGGDAAPLLSRQGNGEELEALHEGQGVIYLSVLIIVQIMTIYLIYNKLFTDISKQRT